MASVNFKYFLEGSIIPKQRPNFNGKNAYLPKKYREWKEDAYLQLIAQSRPSQPLKKVSVCVTLKGKHNLGQDGDNDMGAILDALVEAEVIKDDNLKHVPKQSIEVEHNKEFAPTAEIEITPLD